MKHLGTAFTCVFNTVAVTFTHHADLVFRLVQTYVDPFCRQLSAKYQQVVAFEPKKELIVGSVVFWGGGGQLLISVLMADEEWKKMDGCNYGWKGILVSVFICSRVCSRTAVKLSQKSAFVFTFVGRLFLKSGIGQCVWGQ